jgi:hypothetical protein
MRNDPGLIWRPVESSHVAMIGWPRFDQQLVVDAQMTTPAEGGPPNFEYKLLLVLFKDGHCYGYLGVSRQRAVWMATQCLSVGSYVNHVIKPQFKAVRIPELDVTSPPF